MRTVTVKLPQRTYDIHIGIELLASPSCAQALATATAGRSCAIVTDSNVEPLCLPTLANALESAGVASSSVHTFPAGESSKTLATIEDFYHHGVSVGLDRGSTVLALGGGVTGDMAGFFAATYMRGIGYIQLPTTLLAMVDSSVGGKTGVDLPEGKNLVGAFYQPDLVVANLTFLNTLPIREMRCGLAEIVKYGVIMDAGLFSDLEANVSGLIAPDLALYEDVVSRCCELKAQVVEEDEKEHGRRAILNYGHTFGHALEALGDFTSLNHGEAVAIGMGMAADLALALDMCPPELVQRQNALLMQLGLPTRLAAAPIPAPAAVLETMFHDKKTRSGQLRLVLPTDIGSVSVLPCDNHQAVITAIGGRLG